MSRLLGNLSVTEEVGVPRQSEVVVAGLRVTGGPRMTGGDLRLVVRQGEEWQPGQLLASRTSADGTLRWLALAFPVSVDAGGCCDIAVYAEDEELEAANAVTVRRDTGLDGIALDWSGLRAQFAAGRFLVLPGDLLTGGVTVSAELDGQVCTGVIERADVVHAGPLLAEVHLSGRYAGPTGPAARLEARVRACAQTSALQIDVSLMADRTGQTVLDAWRVELETGAVVRATVGAFERGLSAVPPLSFGHAGGGHPRGIFAVSTVTGGADWRDDSEPGYLARWEWAELHGQVAQNWLVTELSDGARSIAVERLCEHHPARVDCKPTRVTVQLFDGAAGGAHLTTGSAPRRRLAVSAVGDRRAGARLDHPLVAFQPDALNTIRPGILPYLPSELPNLESLVRAELFGWYLSGQSLGFYDHGDGMQSIPSGPRVGYSSNNEHDAIYALLLHYLRSGERAYLDSARAYGDHTIDIDQIHFSEQPHELGGLRAHGRSHVNYVEARTPAGPVLTSIDSGHMWVEGLLLLTELTGDGRYLDAAIGVGDCLLRLESLGWTRPEPGPRNAGWPLIALAALSRATGERRFQDALDRIAHSAIARQQPDGRWLMRLGFLRDYCAWQNSVLLVGLTRAAQVLHSAEMDAAVERGGRAMLTLGRTPEGTFIYLGRYDYRWPQRSGLVREALACLYTATKDPDYLTAGLAGGSRWYPVQGRQRVTSEDIAEWRGHLPFLGCAYSAGLLEDLP